MRCLILYLAFFCILCGCKKDPLINKPCVTYTGYDGKFACGDTALNYAVWPAEPFTGWAVYIANRNFFSLGATPDVNQSHFLYYVTDDEGGQGGLLYKYNMVNRQKTYMDKQLASIPEMHRNGWLVYYKHDWNIYKIKSTGDSLTQLTFDGQSLRPFWNESGDKIFYNPQSFSSTFIMDKNGVRLDTQKVYPGLYYYSDSVKVCSNQQTVVKLNTVTNSTINLITFNDIFAYVGAGDFNRLVYEPKEQAIYFSGGKGLFKKDLNTQVITPLFKNTLSSHNGFAHFRQSPQTKNWYCNMDYGSVKNAMTIHYQSSIYEFSPDFNCRRAVPLFE